MKTANSLFKNLDERLFSSTYQMKRIVILLGIILVIGTISFGAYYYYDRYYSSQQTVKQLSIAEAEQAVRDDPQSVDKRLMLAQTYLLYRRFDDAITQAMQVKNAKPDNLEVDLVLGVAYANSGRPNDALDPLGKFIDSRKNEDMAALDKELQSAFYYLGDSYLQLGQPQQAIAPLEATVNYVQMDADSIYKLGLAYAGVKRYEDAVAAFQRTTAFVPNYTEAYQAMAQVYTAMGNTAEAAYAQAMVAYSQKNYASALAALKKVTQADPKFAPAFTGIGLTCEAQKDLQCALAAYQTATGLDPNDFTASQGLQRAQAGMQK